MCNSRGENATTTAEFTIALMLACMRRLSQIDSLVKKGEWHSWTWRHDQYELRGKTVGIVGGGAIGKEVMKRLQGWDCRLIYRNRSMTVSTSVLRACWNSPTSSLCTVRLLLRPAV